MGRGIRRAERYVKRNMRRQMQLESLKAARSNNYNNAITKIKGVRGALIGVLVVSAYIVGIIVVGGIW